MIRRWLPLSFGIVLAWSTTAGATPNALYLCSFDVGLEGWHQWIVSGSMIAETTPDTFNLGTYQPPTADLLGQVAGSNYVGGIWTIIPVPLGVPMQFDGLWRSFGWVEAQVALYDFYGYNAPVDGEDILGPWVYGNDTVMSPPGWSGVMFDSSYHFLNGTLEQGSQTGQVVLLLRSASMGGGVQYENLILTLKLCNYPPQDADGDGDVDLNDFSVFQSCFNGPNRPWGSPPPEYPAACMCFDNDADGDVDLNNFSVFQGCFNGPNRPAACPGT